MALVYFDTSVVLSFLLNEEKHQIAQSLWSQHHPRCASVLLEAESWIGLRRQRSRLGKNAPENWLEIRERTLTAMLNEVSLHVVGASVTAIVKREPVLAHCRSLDAIHLATVLDLRDHSDGGIRMATFDAQMRQTAMSLKIEVIPSV